MCLTGIIVDMDYVDHMGPFLHCIFLEHLEIVLVSETGSHTHTPMKVLFNNLISCAELQRKTIKKNGRDTDKIIY